MNSMIRERLFPNQAALIAALVSDCSDALRSGVSQRGRASFLVSGGKTPQPVYEQLAHQDLPWPLISVALVDERWVDEDQPASNTAMVKRSLLCNGASRAHFIAMKTAHEHARQGVTACHAAYQTLPQPFDLTLLGMGDDGHTASLFPHAQGLAAALDPEYASLVAAIRVDDPAKASGVAERMTLTRSALLASRQIALLITGEKKREVLRAALAGNDIAAMPVRAVLHQRQVPVTVYWAP